MGKVGSSSIYHPLKKKYAGVVVHTHQFNQQAWYWEVRQLHKLFYNNQLTKFKIISLIREPIGRNVSEFFHRMIDYAGIDPEHEELSSAELLERFLKNLDHDFALNWFDDNFKRHFAIDVYKNKFPEIGYSKFVNNGVEILIMKHDIPDKKKEDLINEFVDVTEFKVEQRNVGEAKAYRLMYKQFKTEVKLPFNYLNKMRDSKYFNHFYSQDYIERIIKKWS